MSDLQTPEGKDTEETSVQTPKGSTESEDELILPSTEPTAIPEGGDLEAVDTIIIKDGESYRQMKVFSVKKLNESKASEDTLVKNEEQSDGTVKKTVLDEWKGKKEDTESVATESIDCEFCEGKGKVIVEKKGVKECPRCEGEGTVESNEPNQEQVSQDVEVPQEVPVEEDPNLLHPEEVPVEEEIKKPSKHPDNKIDFKELSKEHYDKDGTYWFTTDNGKKVGVKKGQTLEDALSASGIPDDGVDQSDVTAEDMAKNEDTDDKPKEDKKEEDKNELERAGILDYLKDGIKSEGDILSSADINADDDIYDIFEQLEAEGKIESVYDDDDKLQEFPSYKLTKNNEQNDKDKKEDKPKEESPKKDDPKTVETEWGTEFENWEGYSYKSYEGDGEDLIYTSNHDENLKVELRNVMPNEDDDYDDDEDDYTSNNEWHVQVMDNGEGSYPEVFSERNGDTKQDAIDFQNKLVKETDEEKYGYAEDTNPSYKSWKEKGAKSTLDNLVDGSSQSNWDLNGINEKERIMKETGIKVNKNTNWSELSAEQQDQLTDYYFEDKKVSDEDKSRRSDDFEVKKSTKELVDQLNGKGKVNWSNIDGLRYASLLEERSEYRTLDEFSNRDQTNLFKKLDKLLTTKGIQKAFREITGIQVYNNGYGLKNGGWSKLEDIDKIKLLDFNDSLSKKSKESKATEARYVVFGGHDESYFEVTNKTDDLELAKAMADDASAEDITVAQNSTIPEVGVIKGSVKDLNTGDIVYSAESKANEYYTKEKIDDEIRYLEKRIDNLTGDYSRTQQLGDAKFSLSQLMRYKNEGETEVMAEDTYAGKNYDYVKESKASDSCGCKAKSMEAYQSFVSNKLEELQSKAKSGESVGLLYGQEVEVDGRKIKGTLAYAGVSLNDRIYLPEELAKGDGKTLPLLLNHSSISGAEMELDRLDDTMKQHLENGRDFKVGEVTLEWMPDQLTLYYEGEVTDNFFKKEIDEMNMSVSLGIYYDSDSPSVCNDKCYTVITGAEFREVSLVYHAGFPIATIEEVESGLKSLGESVSKVKSYECKACNEGGMFEATEKDTTTYKCMSCGKTDWTPMDKSMEAQLLPQLYLPDNTMSGIKIPTVIIGKSEDTQV